MKKLISKIDSGLLRFKSRARTVLANNDGDQITGWLIVVLLVVVVGAFFLSTYQDTIEELWEAIVDKIYDTFGI